MGFCYVCKLLGGKIHKSSQHIKNKYILLKFEENIIITFQLVNKIVLDELLIGDVKWVYEGGR